MWFAFLAVIGLVAALLGLALLADWRGRRSVMEMGEPRLLVERASWPKDPEPVVPIVVVPRSI